MMDRIYFERLIRSHWICLFWGFCSRTNFIRIMCFKQQWLWVVADKLIRRRKWWLIEANQNIDRAIGAQFGEQFGAEEATNTGNGNIKRSFVHQSFCSIFDLRCCWTRHIYVYIILCDYEMRRPSSTSFLYQHRRREKKKADHWSMTALNPDDIGQRQKMIRN